MKRVIWIGIVCGLALCFVPDAAPAARPDPGPGDAERKEAKRERKEDKKAEKAEKKARKEERKLEKRDRARQRALRRLSLPGSGTGRSASGKGPAHERADHIRERRTASSRSPSPLGRITLSRPVPHRSALSRGRTSAGKPTGTGCVVPRFAATGPRRPTPWHRGAVSPRVCS